MKTYEKKAFLEFFAIYFFSVAILIVLAGFFYYTQMKNQSLKQEQFSIIKYAREIKMGNNVSNYKGYRYDKAIKISKYIDIKNFKIKNDEFIKQIPFSKDMYFKVYKSTKEFEQKLKKLQLQIIIFQLFLLLLFGYISYKLALHALKPLKESIITLDKFAKDLIHDLNTPVTSINLNMEILTQNEKCKDVKALKRITQSINTISELHKSLTILLQEETFQFETLDAFNLVEEVVLVHKEIYPNINFIVEKRMLKVYVNKEAFKQILSNIISNASKYNKKDGFVKIYTKENQLYIEDSGYGIKEAKKIFDRNFSMQNSSGIGLDIVKRLSLAMDIEIEVSSNSDGSVFVLRL